MQIAIYPGSFDPITFGHLDIIQRAALIFEKVIVAVSVNQSKVPLFTKEERVDMLRHETNSLKNIEVTAFNGLLSDFAREKGALVIVRGLRAITDFDNEFQMALMNRKLNKQAETVFLVAHPKYSFLSSSIVKEIASFGGDVKGFVSEEVACELYQKYIVK
jgi:pantetheine-phosphate adenylyltransferase